MITRTISVCVAGFELEVEVEVELVPGSRGQTGGGPECWEPPEAASFELESWRITSDDTISRLLSVAHKTSQIPVIDATLRELNCAMAAEIKRAIDEIETLIHEVCEKQMDEWIQEVADANAERAADRRHDRLEDLEDQI